MDIETLRVRIEAETSQFKASIQKLKDELAGLEKAANSGGLKKDTFKAFGQSIKAEISNIKSLQKELDKLYKGVAGNLSTGFKDYADKLFEKAYGFDYKTSSQELNSQLQILQQIYEQYNLLTPHLTAQGSIQRQVTQDATRQSQELEAQAHTLKGMELEKYKKMIDDASGQVHKTVKDIKEIPGHLEKTNQSVNKLSSKLKNIVFYRAIRAAISAITSAINDAYELLVRFDKEYNNNTLGFNKTLSDITSAFKRLGASIASALGQLLITFGPVLTMIINGLTTIVNMFNAITAMFNNQHTYTVANPNYWADYADNLDESNTSAKELKKTLASFDELDMLNSNSSSSSGSGGGGINPNDMYMIKELPDWMKKIADNEWMQNILKAIGIVAALAAALGGLRGITDLVRTAFGKKNKALETQSALETTALVPILALVAGYGLLHDKIAELVKKMKEGLAGAMEDAKAWWEEKKAQTEEGWGTIGALAASAWATITEGVKNFFGQNDLQTETGLVSMKTKWSTSLATILTLITTFATSGNMTFSQLMEGIATTIGEGLGIDTENFKNGLQDMADKISQWGQSVSGYFSEVFNGIGSNITNIVNGCIDKLNGLVSAYKTAKAENYASQVSAWQQKVNKAKALGLALVGTFMYTAFRKLTLPSLGSMVPGFANGGVINKPTLGLVGEYTGAKSNPEIITPENKMREVFNEGNTEMLIELKRNNALLAEILNKDNSITIGDDVISAAAARGNKNFAKRTGRSQFAV